MNNLHIIGRLTGDPDLRTTRDGKDVCTFSVAVSRKRKIEGQPDADFFRVSAWGEKGKVCQKYLFKGARVSVTGSVSVSTYTNNKGEARANMDVMADDVEFLSSREERDKASGYERVEPDDMPY